MVESWDGWRHSIDFGDGIVSFGMERGNGSTEIKQKAWELKPEMFEDNTVLDIGAADGYFSFLAERWGATEVTAMDIERTEGFDIAKKILHSKVKHITGDLIHTTPEKMGTFDVVLCVGVLYHMKFPFYALHRVSNLTKFGGTLILETHSTGEVVDERATPGGIPTMLFYPDDELNHDQTNWWGPSVNCIATMIEKVGFKVDKIIYASSPDRYVFYSTKTSGKIDILGHSYEV